MVLEEEVLHRDDPVDLGQHHGKRVYVKAHHAGEDQSVLLGGIGLRRNMVLPPDRIDRLDQEHSGAAAHIQTAGRLIPEQLQLVLNDLPGNPVGGELLPQHQPVLPIGQLGEQLAENIPVDGVGEVVGGQPALHIGNEGDDPLHKGLIV